MATRSSKLRAPSFGAVGWIMLKRSMLAAAGALLALSALPAQALNTRTWISGTGVDQAGCGPIATPCRSLQFAHDNTSAGGEIDVKDPAGYGAIVINKAITIVNDGVGTAGALATAGGNAISIQAGSSDAITLRGLTIEGAAVGQTGVSYQSAANVTMTNCVVQNFLGTGIAVVGNNTASMTIANTVVSQNKFNITINTSNRMNITMDHIIVSEAGDDGITISPQASALTATISNSVINNNNNHGIQTTIASNTNLYLIISSSTISGNYSGIASGGGLVLLDKTIISGNNFGVANSSPVYTYSNNTINGNLNVDIVAPPLSKQFSLQ